MNVQISPQKLTEEQLKALYDPIRIRIANLLKTPRTPKQVADIINVKANNLYYHFRVLEKAGIIEFVETKPGKGFIKENFFRLKNEDYCVLPEMVPLYGRMRFFQNLITAAMDDLEEALGKYGKVIIGVGTRDDFSIPEDKLEEARDIVAKRRNALFQDLREFHDPQGECNYQVNLFCFRL